MTDDTPMTDNAVLTDNAVDRRGLLLAGAGVAATASLLTFEPAEAGVRTSTKVFRGTIDDPDGPDWIYLPFRVPTGVRAIEVRYDYEPTPLGPTTLNVVDIGIFDPSGRGLGNARGFRGWSGGKRRSFRISRRRATPGYLAGPISPGRWHVVLGPYQISGAGTPYRVEVTLHHRRPGAKEKRFVADKAPRSVPGTGAGWYRGDLHIHTVHSDGSQTPRQVIRRARAAGLDFIGTSEHNTTSAQRIWGKVTPRDFLVVSGEEVTTRAGHWLATGLPAGTWIDWRYRPEDQRLSRFTRQVRNHHGLAIAAHPYQIGSGNGWGFGDEFRELDALEVWNGPWSGLNATANTKAVARWHELLTAGVFKPAVGNSDSHNADQRIGLAHSVVRADRLSVRALMAGYRGGHCWITGSTGVDLTFTATLGAVTAECGDRVPSSAGDEVAVRLAVSGVGAGAVATLLGPGTQVHGTAVADSTGSLTLETTVPGGTAFVRAEVRASAVDGAAMVAMTNPIFTS